MLVLLERADPFDGTSSRLLIRMGPARPWVLASSALGGRDAARSRALCLLDEGTGLGQLRRRRGSAFDSKPLVHDLHGQNLPFPQSLQRLANRARPFYRREKDDAAAAA